MSVLTSPHRAGSIEITKPMPAEGIPPEPQPEPQPEPVPEPVPEDALDAKQEKETINTEKLWKATKRANGPASYKFDRRVNDALRKLSPAQRNKTGKLNVWQNDFILFGPHEYSDGKADEEGRTNLELMQEGLAPFGPDGWKVNLHHMGQHHHDYGAISEVCWSLHKCFDTKLHSSLLRGGGEKTEVESKTPLMAAAEEGKSQLVEKLLADASTKAERRRIIKEHYRGVNALGYTIAGDTPQHTECGRILRAAGARDDTVDPRLRNAKNRQSLALCDRKFRNEFESRKRLYWKDRAAEFEQRQSLSKESLSQDRA
jgi:hypothetical protein